MRRLLGATLLVLALAFLAAPLALGAEGGEHHASIDPKTLALQLLNFSALLFILIRFAGPAVNKALRARHEQLKADLDDAAKLKAAAEQRFEAQERRLANLEQELAAMQEAIKKEAESEKARIVAAAEERARRIQEDTKFQLDQQVKEAEIRFRNEVASAAVSIAAELLRKQVSAADEQRLAQTFVADLVAGRAAGHEAPRPAAPPAREEAAG